MTLRSTLARTLPAVVATAVVGGLGTKPTSDWYLALDKPSWQPPGWLFGPVWTALYGAIAVGTARALTAIEDPAERASLERALYANLALNTAWSWLFFTARRPALALAEIGVLDASTLHLARRVAAVDPAGGAGLAAYAGWNLFATALNAEIVRRNS